MTQAFYNNVGAGVVWDGTTSKYFERYDDTFFIVNFAAGYTGPRSFYVMCAPRDTTQAPGVCLPLLSAKTRFQWAPPVCPGFGLSTSGDLILSFAAQGVAPTANQIAGVAGTSVNIRMPQCPGCEFLSLELVSGTAADMTIQMIWNSNTRR
jgi:hypothetical protein